jgi:hypothetical protein
VREHGGNVGGIDTVGERSASRWAERQHDQDGTGFGGRRDLRPRVAALLRGESVQASTVENERVLLAERVSVDAGDVGMDEPDAAASFAEQGVLRSELDAPHAADILWFYTGPWAYRAFVTDRGWTLDEYEGWLAETLRTQLMRDDA